MPSNCDEASSSKVINDVADIDAAKCIPGDTSTEGDSEEDAEEDWDYDSEDSESTNDEKLREQDAKAKSMDEDQFKKEMAAFKRELYEPSRLVNDEMAQKQLVDNKKELFRAQLYIKSIHISKRNVLFYLASDGDDAPQLPALVKSVMEEYPDLLSQTDEVRRNALHYAIERMSDWFVRAVLESDVPVEDIQKALAEREVYRPNCIHTAITKGFTWELTVKLIEKASKETLVAQDGSGYTPLHLAVEYSRCTNEGRKIVQALLEHGDAALDKFTGPPDHFSVFEYHVSSRPQPKHENVSKPGQNALQQKGSKKTKTGLTAPVHLDKGSGVGHLHSQGESLVHDAKSEPADPKGPMKVVDPQAVDRKAPKDQREQKEPLQQEARPGALRRATTVINNANEGRPLSAQNGLMLPPAQPQLTVFEQTRNSRKSSDKSQSGTSRRGKPKGTKSQARTSSTVDVNREASLEVADLIAKDLKLHYFRTTFNKESGRTHSSAERFLFGDNRQCTLICFKFPASPRKKQIKIDFLSFEESFSLFSFDSALLYIDFGTLELEVFEDTRPRRVEEGAGAGKRDMLKFFRWLFDQKGVRNIIKVTVQEELQGAPHCDQAIVDSLNLFEIEILDWRKVDLCPCAIQQGAKNSTNLRELHLQWSGSNAVLRGWSEPNGLAKLTSLKQVHVWEIKPSLDSARCIKAWFDDFSSRININRSQSSLIITKLHAFGDTVRGPHGGHPQGIEGTQGANRPKTINEHDWLNTMDAFADAIMELPELDTVLDDSEKKTSFEKLHEELTKPVTVALIDDGVDYMHPAIRKNLLPGKSFDSGHGSYDVLGTPEPYHVSTNGHGTFMAYMIQRVCPTVKIFVYKIDPLITENQSTTFYAKSAADAVEDALKRSFDIISMSWSVQPTETGGVSNQEDLRRLVAALQAASNDKEDQKGKKKGKESILFCSASDHGQSNGRNTHYPFNCDGIPKMFRIGAANADGTRYSWTSDQVDFILPGADVRMRANDRAGFNQDTVPKTGSSVATALAAGLAALVIQIVKQGAIYHALKDTTGLSEKSVRAIKTYKAMKSAFEVIRKDGGNEPKDERLAVGAFFTKAGRELSKNSSLDAKSKWIVLAKLARDLISSSTENAVG